MRYLGLDLGTKSLGIAITDRSCTIASVLKVIKFSSNDYNYALNEVLNILNEYEISKIALGLPKNMNNSCGFASERSMNFKKLLEEKTSIPVYLVDERLSTTEAENILVMADMSREKRKKVIDGVAAQIILETFMKMEENRND
ncbi:MAG: Holliday junction resolvase RuvX [Firmicutes bacterium]|nr:Holliday junction resolvase RuvX [Bacillota bacterium]